ncbi:MAG: MaoC family dehydratase [Chloroflexi bacterium]|nr:MaoC family dehydratase [Chloroflexota bacterium]MCY3938639.1 MaoC family dehydratase [Chloroflexota bacterium]
MSIRDGWRGRFFEDFDVGDVYRHPLGRTITEADNTWFTLLTMNTNPLHFDAHYAEKGEFGRPLVNSALTLAIVLGQSVTDTSQNAIANLGWDKIRLTHPVYAGDTLYSESVVMEVRESESRPHAGIVKVKTRGLNQHGDVCIDYLRTFMVYKTDAAISDSTFPVAATPIAHGDGDPI